MTAVSLTDELALSSDVLVVRVRDLPGPVRDELGDDGAFAVTRARGRTPSVLVDEGLAELLGEFREPSTIVEAVLRYSRRHRADAEAVLSESYPALRRFRSAGYLRGAGDVEEGGHRIAFAVGERVAGGTVIRCVRVLEDTELYQVALDGGGLAACKVLRPGRSGDVGAALAREARILSLIDGRGSPRLLADGETGGNPWLCMDWIDGVPVSAAAAGLRRAGRRDAESLDLGRRVVAAYADLHGRGIVHGDVHPANVLVSPAGAVWLLDFGLARLVDDPEPVPRGGVTAYFDPQYARSLLAGAAPPQASFASDRYALGALLYQALTGSTYLDFALDRAEMLRQVVEDGPLPFTRRDRRPWPELEDSLAAALAKDPRRRPASTAGWARQLAALADGAPAASHRPGRETGGPEAVLSEVIGHAEPGGSWFDRGLPAAPFCSVAYGAAGLAAALCRVGVLRGDPRLVTLADEWVVRAAREADGPEAFSSVALDLDEHRTGRVSPFHQLSGVHAVQAMVSHALGDSTARRHALRSFVAHSRQPCANLDLTLGRSGTLLAAALLVEGLAGTPAADTAPVVELGGQTLREVWREVDAQPAAFAETPMTHLGVAHGWAGVLLATLRWCTATGTPVPAGLWDRLDRLAALAQPAGLGARWPWTLDRRRAGPATMPGWCNGSAGFVHLWTTAHVATADGRWEELAERAAWDTYLTPTTITQLCCGLAGQAYALLAMYRHSGRAQWLTLAGELAARAAAGVRGGPGHPVAGSLHKGVVGVAALAADLADPEAAAMPFFGVVG